MTYQTEQEEPQMLERTALHTTEQAAAALEVPAHLVRQWRRAGRAMPAGMLRAPVPGGLQPLYKLAELEPLAEQYHARNRRRRNVPADPTPACR